MILFDRRQTANGGGLRQSLDDGGQRIFGEKLGEAQISVANLGSGNFRLAKLGSKAGASGKDYFAVIAWDADWAHKKAASQQTTYVTDRSLPSPACKSSV